MFLILSFTLAQCRAQTSAQWLAARQALHILPHASLPHGHLLYCSNNSQDQMKLSPTWGWFCKDFSFGLQQ